MLCVNFIDLLITYVEPVGVVAGVIDLLITYVEPVGVVANVVC